MSTTLERNNVPKHDFTKSITKGELNSLYAGNGKYCRKVAKQIRAVMLVTSVDIHGTVGITCLLSKLKNIWLNMVCQRGIELMKFLF